ncbi:unnamed protein product [Kuraishia capsulata CBS 1993]|uniref:Small ribosomal subunit protein uS9m n=1 Tax=Kuraishia capsulata CBS 1993 TaxID=1382522 RepID=W6MU67_9ASCO|nr:uncharacterized protein KUCA_T00004897001 [Kuraishia capsulata CBS 1993]CDK28912.1 unnamed protein product [Kuraishia capsulata CBS 1993]
MNRLAWVTSRLFSTTARVSAISRRRAYNTPKVLHSLPQYQPSLGAFQIPELERTRIVPQSPNYYSGNPMHEEFVEKLNVLLRKYISLPFDMASSSKSEWLTYEQYLSIVDQSGTLSLLQHDKLVRQLIRLAAIDPQLQSGELLKAIEPFRRKKDDSKVVPLQKELDHFGRSVTVGRRKTASAKCYLVEGEGKIIINGRPLNEYFPKVNDRSKVLHPLKVVESEGKYNIFVKVRGGGVTGQADATALGIARGIIVHNPLLKKRLRAGDCLTRDSRHVERKKPGKVKARKSPTWVKR